jgi:phosphate-selective porin OprO/OprP
VGKPFHGRAAGLCSLLLFSIPSSGHAGGLESEFSGYLAAGVDHYDAFYDEDGETGTTEAVIRNAKLELELAFGDHWEAELDGAYDYQRGEYEVEPGDLYLQYNRGSGVLRMGQFKEPFGLERLSGYTSLNTSERSVVTSSFAPGRNTGALIGLQRKRSTAVLGVFTDRPEGGEMKAITGRATHAPVFGDGQVLHLGLAASYRDLAGERFQIKDEGEVFSADNVIRSPRFDAKDTALAGMELGWTKGPFTLISEAVVQDVRQQNGDHWRFSGAYLSAGWFLTDDRREYERGEFDRVEPSGTWGAVELVTRFSHVDLRDRQLGAEASVAVLGINYWYGEHVQLRVNYLWPRIEGNTLMAEPDGHGMTGRLVLMF